MQTEIAKTILARLNSDSPPAVGLTQIGMWVVPQKGEHDHDYSINQGYFEALLRQAISDLLASGYITSSVHDGIEDGDARLFFLTDKGAKYVEELAAASIEQ